MFSLWILLVSLRYEQRVWMPTYQPLPTEATSRRLREVKLHLFFVCFVCLGQGMNIQKQLCIWENLGSYHICSGKDRLAYSLRRPYAFTLPWSLAQIPYNNILKIQKPWGRFFRFFHIRFKYPIFKNNNKNHKAYKENRSMPLSK